MPTNLTIPTRRQDGTKSKNVDLFTLCVYLGCVLASVSISSCTASRYCRLNRLTLARVHDNQLIRREDLESLLGRNGEAIRDQFLSISLPSPSLSLSPLWVSEWECVCVCVQYICVCVLSFYLSSSHSFVPFPLGVERNSSHITGTDSVKWNREHGRQSERYRINVFRYSSAAFFSVATGRFFKRLGGLGRLGRFNSLALLSFLRQLAENFI